MRTRGLSRLLRHATMLLAVTAGAIGCRDDGLVDLLRVSDDRQANQVLLALAGIGATKEESGSGARTTILIRVPREHRDLALLRLDDSNLIEVPRRDYEKDLPERLGGLNSESVESARVDLVAARRIEDALRQFDAVRDAWVLLPAAHEEPGADGERRVRSTSVVVVHRPLEPAACDELERTVRDFVSCAIDGVDEERIVVRLTPARERPPFPAEIARAAEAAESSGGAAEGLPGDGRLRLYASIAGTVIVALCALFALVCVAKWIGLSTWARRLARRRGSVRSTPEVPGARAPVRS